MNKTSKNNKIVLPYHFPSCGKKILENVKKKAFLWGKKTRLKSLLNAHAGRCRFTFKKDLLENLREKIVSLDVSTAELVNNCLDTYFSC
jgi:hypothetical protein